MENSNSKSRAKAKRNFSRFLLLILISGPVMLTLMVLPWVFWRSEIWSLSQYAILLPLSSTLFELPFQILGNHRLILPDWSLQLVLVTLTCTAPLILALLYLLTRRIIRHSPLMSYSVSMLVLVTCYRFGFPGTSPHLLAPWVGACLLISPVLFNSTGFGLWFTATLGVALSILFPILQGQVFWTAFSLAGARALHFLIVERLRLKRSERIHLWLKMFQISGSISLLLFILLSMKHFEIDPTHFGYSHRWYLAFTGGLLVLAMSLLKPWQSLKWMTLATFCQGVLLFKSMEIPVLIIHAYLGVSFLYEGLNWLEGRMPSLFGTASRMTYAMGSLVFSFAFLTQQAKTIELRRDFDPEWVQLLPKISPEGSDGYFVIGRGLSFLAQFRNSQFIFDPSLLFESSEEKWMNYLKENKLNSIVIEVPQMKELWAEWIKSGQKPDRINKSVISRLVTYKGNEIKSSTLKLEKIKNLQVEKLPEIENLMLIKVASGK